MIKKTIMATAGAAMLAGVLFGTESVSYFTTSANWVRDSVKQSVPLEFEIERARNMVKDLSSDIQQSMHTIATEEVEVERLTKQIKQLQETQANDRLGVLKLQNELSSNKQSFEFGGKTFTVSQVKADLSNRFERFKTNDATLESLADIHSARQKSLDAARQKLEGMLAAKRKLEVDVQNCEARLNMLAAAQTTSEVTLDDSRLSRAKNLIADVQTRLSVATKQLEASSRLQSDIPLDKPAEENVVDQVTEYFRSQQTPAANVAQQ
jgi:chromosome segregation ATPase